MRRRKDSFPAHINEADLAKLVRMGARIRELRLQLDMTRAELAKRCGMTEERLSKIESGLVDQPLATAHRIAHELETSVVFFYTCLYDDELSQALDELRHLPKSELPEATRKVMASAKKNLLFPFDGDG